MARVQWSVPDTRALLVCVALAAAWETRSSTLLGVGVSTLSVALQIVLWMLLFGMLVLAYGAIVPGDRQSMRRVSRRLGAALLLALASADVVRLATSPALEPVGWHGYHYLRLLVPLGFVAVWCTALLPRETRAIVRAVKAIDAVAALPALTVLLFVAAALVSASDLAFQLVRSGSAVENRLAVDVIEWRAWLTTTLVLFGVFTVVFAASSRAVTSIVLVSPIYGAIVFATIAKIKYMHSAVQPLDVLRLPEFMPLFASFFGFWALAASGLALVLWIIALVISWRRWRVPIPTSRRIGLGVGSFALLATVLMCFLPPSRVPHALGRMAVRLRAAAFAAGGPLPEHREMARNSGIVLNFLYELPTAFIATPAGYSAAAVESALHGYAETGATPSAARQRAGVNLVVYVVESLMDPDELGMQFTADPMPTFRQLHHTQVHGYGIVPNSFGGSASTEFELLTGMTTSFLPTGSTPYRQYIRRPLSSLPRVLRDRGYATVAIQADPRYYYDRERVYPLLGFESTVWLHGARGVQRAQRGRWPSDDAVVDAVIAASRQARPFFVFAFPSSTHAPYNTGVYAGSALDVAGAPSAAANAEVKEYVNAIRVADRAIGRLVEHFRGEKDSTIVVVLGDHLPPLTAEAYSVFSDRLKQMSAPERDRAARRVPLVVWANFELPTEEKTLSVNLLPPYLLEKLGVPRAGLFAVTDSVRRLLPVVSALLQGMDGRLWPRTMVPAAFEGILHDYQLVQYDFLLGEQFALGARAASPPGATPSAAVAPSSTSREKR
jgi:hypothetical protein